MNSPRRPVFHAHTIWLILMVITTGALLLGSCRAKTTPEATEAPATTAPVEVTEAPAANPGAGGEQPAVTDEPYPGPGGAAPVVTDEPYPGPQGGAPIVTVDAYPGPQGGAPIVTEDAYPAPGAQEPAAGSSPTPGSVTAAATAATAVSTPAPTVADPNAYPGPAVVPTYNPYPGSGNPSTAPPTYNPYPGPGAGATVTPLPATPSGLPGTGTPTPTPSFQTSVTPQGQPTTFILTTPTPSPSPTPSATPVPPTLDLSARLRASNPRSVKLASGKVQLIEFFAFWDGPSKSMASMMSNLETQYGEQVNFIYLDIDDPKTAALRKSLYYRSQPEFVLVDSQGKVLKRWSGYVKRAELEKAILEVLPKE